MKLERYNAFHHYPMLKEWWASWKQEPVPTTMLPNTGVVVEDFVAAFLYRTDSDFCFIENLITRRAETEEDRQIRDEAIDWAIQSLCSLAKDAGYTVIGAFSGLPQVVARGSRLGFDSKPQTLTFMSRRL